MKINIPKQKVPSGLHIINTIPGDKSISHRSVILGSLSDTTLHFKNVLFSTDCLNTITIFQKLGVSITVNEEEKSMEIIGVGLNGLKESSEQLDVGNSGTAIRLITGVLAAQKFDSQITGDHSIQGRPMKRICTPLSQMGAKIKGQDREGNVFPPLQITGVKRVEEGAQHLEGISYKMPVASAQVKSAILLAGLWAEGKTTVTEPEICRDHTERMLVEFGVEITIKERRESHGDDVGQGREIILTPPHQLRPKRNEYQIPSDISSAAFFTVLGAICQGMDLELSHIGNNPTRNRIIKVLDEMNASIQVSNVGESANDNSKSGGHSGEPVATIRVGGSQLRNITVSSDDIPIIIDEIPILAAAALFGDGPFTVRNAKELRVKESDRISAIGGIIKGIGAGWEEFEDGFTITPAVEIKDGKKIFNYNDFELDSHGDHRIAMSGIIAALGAGVSVTVQDCENINTSFPNFLEILTQLNVQFSVE